MELKKLFFINFSGYCVDQSELSPSFLNYMRSNNKIAIKDQQFYLPEFDPNYLNNKSIEIYQELLDKYKSAAALLRKIPGVRAFSLCNSLSLGTYHPKSDVDLFLILDSKSFFTSRLLIIILFEIWRLRPSVCLSFWVSDKSIDLNCIQFDEDIYLENWKNNLAFETSDSQLIKDFNHANQTNIKSHQSFVFRPMPSVIESFLCKYQIKRAQTKAQQLDDTSGIVIKDGFLKFHHNDIRSSFNRYYRLGYDEFLQGNRVKTYQQYLQEESK